ncbi:MAG: polysaccharide biosynthesis protein [Bacteroidaceae bacterium]|nr:polysaccharide biosynthesis protein [Bacteroidaceae bacterium]
MGIGIYRRLSAYLSKYLSTRVVFVVDLVTATLSSLLVILVANIGPGHFMEPYHDSGRFIAMWCLVAFISYGLASCIVKNYRIIIRHSTLIDMGKIVMCGVIKDVLMAVFVSIGSRLTIFETSVIVLSDLLLTVINLLFVRLLMISAYDYLKARNRDSQNCMRILVYGTSDKAIATITRLESSPHYEVVGFIVRDMVSRHMRVSDYNVYQFRDADGFRSLADSLDLGGILFTTESDAQAEQNGLIHIATELGKRILMVPTINEVDGSNMLHYRIRDIRIEDLLGRPEINISLDEIRKNFKDRVILVTGAAGSIGSELCRQLAGYGVRKLVLFDNAETPMHNLRLELEDTFKDLSFVPVIGDVRSASRLDFVFREYRPSVVFHAAAYKHVPLMEENPCEAVRVNVVGSSLVADKCIEYDVDMMVMISTDKAVNPTNVMGCSKRLAEIYVQSLGLAIESGVKQGHTKFVTTRFGNVLGSNGSVIPRFRSQIERGGPVTVTDPRINRFFMTIPEACRLVMEAATMSTGNQIMVFDMGKSVRIVDLARRMIELAGFVPDRDIQIIFTGLRPGEKLYEEVLSTTEDTDPTSHDRIRVARVRQYDFNEAESVVRRLEQLCADVNIPETVKLMKKTVPEFKSKNSRFEIYDRTKEQNN